jgi:nicotinate-nucleotide adenylyltransferase
VKDLPTWHDPLRIIDRATILVAARRGHPIWTAADLAGQLRIDEKRVRLRPIDVPLIDIASRDLRRRGAEGRSLLFQLPRAVEVYIREKKLYR